MWLKWTDCFGPLYLQPHRHVTFKHFLTLARAARLGDYGEILSSVFESLNVKPVSRTTRDERGRFILCNCGRKEGWPWWKSPTWWIINEFLIDRLNPWYNKDKQHFFSGCTVHVIMGDFLPQPKRPCFHCCLFVRRNKKKKLLIHFIESWWKGGAGKEPIQFCVDFSENKSVILIEEKSGMFRLLIFNVRVFAIWYGSK